MLPNQSFFELAASLANRSAFRRSKFLRSAICSFSYSVGGLSDGRNTLLASFSRLLMTCPFELPGIGSAIANGIAIREEQLDRKRPRGSGLGSVDRGRPATAARGIPRRSATG